MKKTFFIFILLQSILVDASNESRLIQLNKIEDLLKKLRQSSVPTQPKSLKRVLSKQALMHWKKYRKSMQNCPPLENTFDFEGLNISNMDFSGISLRGANFNKCQLANVDFQGADLTDTTFEEAVFKKNVKLDKAILCEGFTFDVSLSHINLVTKYSDLLRFGKEREAAALNRLFGALKLELSNCSFNKRPLRGINFQGAVLMDIQFVDSDLSYANFTHVNLQNVNLTRANLIGTVFTDANLNDTDLFEARLSKNITFNNIEQVFSEWYLAMKEGDQETIEAYQRLINAQVPVFLSASPQLLQSIDWKNKNWSNANFSNINLRGLDFTGSNLQKADLKNANLIDTTLTNTNLNNADLRNARLTEDVRVPDNENLDVFYHLWCLNPAACQKIVNAHFNLFKDSSHSCFKHTNWREKDLSNANLYGVDLHKIDLTGSNLQNADLRFANLTETQLKKVNLINARLNHAKLSNTFSLSSDWIYKSYFNLEDNILERFECIVVGMNFQE